MGLNANLDLTAEQRGIIFGLLRTYLPNVTVWAYGSRVRWNARPYSDLDLVAFTSPGQESQLANLKDAFEESNLPFEVDLLAWDDLPESFHRRIKQEYAVLQEQVPKEGRVGWHNLPFTSKGAIVQPIDVSPSDLETVQRILQKHVPELEVRAFGSRVSWTARETSDLDLALMTTEPLDLLCVAEMREAFDESALPFRVDLVDWATTSKNFRKVIEREYVVVRKETGGLQGAGGEWRERMLGELVRNFDSRRVPLSRREREERCGKYPYYGATGIMDYVDGFLFEGLHLLVAEDGSVERPDGKPFLQLVSGKFWVNNHAHVLQGDTDQETRFLHYALSTIPIRPYMSGSVQAKLSQGNLNKISVPYPSRAVDRNAIAYVLGTLDDKIELNRRMNQTLEAMARALFKSWFIDFDPVHAKATLKQQAASEITPPLRGSRQAKGASPQARRWGVIRRGYTQRTLTTAQTLRRNRTDAEGLLWYYLRNNQLDGHRFRRQHPIGPYIVDFACLTRKVLIELDGSQHAERQADDKKRDAFLRAQGYRVLRFWNNEVFENCFGVLERIYEAVTEHPPPQPPAPDALTAPTPPQGGSDWTVERARAYLDGMSPEITALFPDRFVDSELGNIPEGWSVVAIEDIAEISSGKRPKVKYAETSDLARVPLWGGNGPMAFPEPLVECPILLTGRVGTLGSIFRIASPCWPSDNTLILKAKDKRSFEFLFFQLQRIDVTALNRGTTQPLVTQTDLKRQLLLMPPTSILERFHVLTETLYAKFDKSQEESHTLTALRDVLIPKLVSGKIRMSRISMENNDAK